MHAVSAGLYGVDVKLIFIDLTASCWAILKKESKSFTEAANLNVKLFL